ncbi:MAG: glycosyltransferase, partial [Lentisphaeraceae bacterium]|nr:glycosyltransferase [Lentisphaeraceae bacterium]
LDKLNIAYKTIETKAFFSEHIHHLQQEISLQEASYFIPAGNDADVDISLLSLTPGLQTICNNENFPIFDMTLYDTGFWNENISTPTFRSLSLYKDWKMTTIPQEVLDYCSISKPVCIVTENPLECFEGLTEDKLINFSFVTNHQDLDSIMMNCREVLSLDNFSEDLEFAKEYGCDFFSFRKNRKYLYESLTKSFDNRRKLKKDINELSGKKSTQNIKLPRIVHFQRCLSAPIIKEISHDISAALRSLNVDVLDIDLSNLQSALETNQQHIADELKADILKKINAFKPDQAIGYNNFGILPSGDSHLLEKMGIPYNGLFFDNPFYCEALLTNCKNKDLVKIFTLDQDLIGLLKSAGFKNTYYFPIATSANQRLYTPKKSEFSSKALFTATVKEWIEKDSLGKQCQNKLDNEFIQFSFDKILNGQIDFKSLLDEFQKDHQSYPESFEQFVGAWFKLDNQCSSRLRIKLINTLEELPINIYGGDNWTKYSIPKAHEYRGYLNYKDLPNISRSSALTLCVSPINIQNGIQQRILDCGAMNAPILADYREVLDEHFKLDEELFIYRNFDELKEKADFLMNNPKAKERSIKLLHQRVLKEHTWAVRMSQFLTMI